MTEQNKQTQPSPFDKEPAEGSRETIDKQLEQQEHKRKQGTADPVTTETERKA